MSHFQQWHKAESEKEKGDPFQGGKNKSTETVPEKDLREDLSKECQPLS